MHRHRHTVLSGDETTLSDKSTKSIYDNIVQIDDRVMSLTISDSNYITIMIINTGFTKQQKQRLIIFCKTIIMNQINKNDAMTL